MTNFIYKKLKYIIFFAILITSISACSKIDRPKMAYDQKDKGTVLEMESFNVKTSAENFQKSSSKFSENAKQIKQNNKNTNSNEAVSRRISLTERKETAKKSLELLDRNLMIRQLETREVSLKLNDMDIKSALKLFASLVQRNIIIGDEVQGQVTIDFENIKWGSAVYAILDINNLVMIEDQDSGLLRVHTKEVFAALEKSKIDNTIKAKNNMATLKIGGSVSTDGESSEPTTTEVFRIFYQKSEDIMSSIEEILEEPEGLAMVNDEPNNQIVISGTYGQLNQIENIINKIDLEKKQVMIEAYIVNAGDEFSKSFSAKLDAANVQNVQAGRDRITMVGIDTNPAAATDFTPTNTISDGLSNTAYTSDDISVAGGFFLLGNIGMTKIKAMINSSVNDANTETVSNPKLFAMDGEEASLTQGTTLVKVIPASGDAAGSTQEIPQNLNISVTPVITGDDKIKLTLSLANDQPGSALADGSVTTKEESLTSVVQVNAGDVAVLGGVYKNTKVDSKNYVPFFSKIPILGLFFQEKTQSDNKTQLLIFLSANIV